MKKILKIVLSTSIGKSISRFLLPEFAFADNASSCHNLAVYNVSGEILHNEKSKKSLRIIHILPAIFLIFTVSFTSAQDVLVGLNSNGGVEGKGTAYSIKTSGSSFNIIKGFADWGSYPVSDLVKGTDGNMYGMTPQGGTFNAGTIFKVTPGGTLTVVKHFNPSVDGGYPKGSLIVAKDGNFYGVANSGTNFNGCIFKLTPAGQYTVIHGFNAGTDGYASQGHLIQASDGNFYGLTYYGGSSGYGTIYKLTPGGQFTVLKAFNGTTNGASSYGSLVQATDGALYGMTYSGGTYKYGVIFRITTGGTYTVLRNLNSATDGGYPIGSLIQAKDGLLYGMTPGGGANYNGTIFKINTSGSSFTVVRALSSGTEGGNPKGSLRQATNGNFYGMCYSMSGGYAGCVFKMTTAGTVTVIKKFTESAEGGYPNGSLVQGTDGLFYGMTYSGGKNGNGTVFKITSGGTLTVLSNLNGASGGNEPQDNITVTKDGAYYGVARNGGAYNVGTIFKICGGVTTALHSFNYTAEGGNPGGGLLTASDGNLYGTTENGGSNGYGTIFKITPAGKFTVLRHLNSATDGGNPKGLLIQGPDSALYGMTSSGGTGSAGTIFKITTGGVFTVLHHLVGATEGAYSEGGLVQGKDGAFYGITGSTSRFFKITKTGAFTVLHTFSYYTEGGSPGGSLIQGTDGYFYGTASSGGSNSSGTIFRLSSTGSITVLRQLNSDTDGKFPEGGLVQGTDGAFYGTTSAGGKYNGGTIFKITTAKAFSVLRHLNIATDGATPLGGLILAPKITLTATSQSNVSVTEDVAKSITLSGTGGSSASTFAIVTQPKNGSVTSGSIAARTYAPAANYNGKDSFAFTINTGCYASAPAWIYINVTAVNDAPVLASIGNKTAVTNTALTFTAKATDADAGQTRTFSLIGAPSDAAINAATGAFSWTPSATGTYTFKVRVTDNGSPALYDEEQITVTVTASFAAAKASTVAATTTEDIVSAKASIYPNPVINSFTIKTDKSDNEVTIRIIDINGSVVYNKKFEGGKRPLHADASNLKPGQYFLQLQNGKNSEILKFIKM